MITLPKEVWDSINDTLTDAILAPNPLLERLMGGPYVITRQQVADIRGALFKVYKRPQRTKIWKMLKDLPEVESVKKFVAIRFDSR